MESNFKEKYEKAKETLLNDKTINKPNKEWIKEVLAYQETKGKRQNGLPSLDNSCYKTLVKYTQMLKNVIIWFDNKPLKSITEEDIKKVYEDLEEQRIKTKSGKILKDKSGYYTKVFKSKPFEMINKKEMAKKIISYTIKTDKEVRFIQNYQDALKSLVQMAISPQHKLLIQLLGDYGENIFSILQLEKKDFERTTDKETGEIYYLVNLHKAILKRTRTARREYNIFNETRQMLDDYLKDLKPTDRLFSFGLRQSEIMFKRTAQKSKILLQNGQTPTLKDLRSSLACYLLSEGWTTDEIKGRLGHKPSSKVLDVYVSYLALNKDKIRKKQYQGNLEQLKSELEKYKEKSRRDSEKIDKFMELFAEMQENIKELNKAVKVSKQEEQFISKLSKEQKEAIKKRAERLLSQKN